MTFLRHIPLLLAAAPLLGGCATALPASEGVIYRHYYPLTETLEPGRSRFRLPVYLTSSSAPKELEAFARRRFERRYSHDPDYRYDYIYNPHRLTGGFSFSMYRSPSTWVNLSLGFFTLGLDATTKLPGSWFATLNVGHNSGGDIILQRPVLLHRFHALTLGGFYRLNSYAVQGSDCERCAFNFNPFNPALWVYVHSMGGRVMWQGANQTDRDLIRLVASAGYSPTLRSPVARLGIYCQIGPPRPRPYPYP